MTEQEPLHVVFAREVLGCKPSIGHLTGVWICGCENYVHGCDIRSGCGCGKLLRYDLDRAYCQELEELNDLHSSPRCHCNPPCLDKWHSSQHWPPGENEPEGTGETKGSADLEWAIMATRAGVPVRLPGQSDTSAMGADGEPTGGPMR